MGAFVATFTGTVAEGAEALPMVLNLDSIDSFFASPRVPGSGATPGSSFVIVVVVLLSLSTEPAAPCAGSQESAQPIKNAPHMPTELKKIFFILSSIRKSSAQSCFFQSVPCLIPVAKLTCLIAHQVFS
jgi:hypothetical protein